jgi:hypothetical protein
MTNSRNNVGDDTIWQHGELPPAAVIDSLGLEVASVDEEEFLRAEWFWRRRPKVLLGKASFVLCYLIVLACLFYFFPGTFWLVLFWILAGAGCAYIDWIRLDEWKLEYASSIKRLLSHLSERQ